MKSKMIKVLVEMEMHNDIVDFDDETITEALHNFGDYRDKILKVEE